MTKEATIFRKQNSKQSLSDLNFIVHLAEYVCMTEYN